MQDIQLDDNQDDDFADLLNNAPENMAQGPSEDAAFIEAVPAYDEPARDSDALDGVPLDGYGAEDVDMVEEEPVNED